MDESRADLSDDYLVANPGDQTTKACDGTPGFVGRLKHTLLFYQLGAKPCGCRFWTRHGRHYPACLPETTVHGSREKVEERREWKNRIEKRTVQVAVCSCDQCGEQFEVEIPWTKWAHNKPRDEPAPDVEGEWPDVTR